MKIKRRFLSLLLSGAMLFSLCSPSVFAEEQAAQEDGQAIETVGLCEHHPEHTTDCGYTEGTPETPCTHEHTPDCYTEVIKCVHEHTPECYPEEAEERVSGNNDAPVNAEEREPENCTHVCSEESGCITNQLDCKHVHDSECGYAPATAGTPCGYVCEICGKPDTDGTEETDETKETEENDIATPTDVQEMMDALPAVGDLESMSLEEQNEVYTALQAAYEAYEALSDQQKAEITGTEIFEKLFAFFNGMVSLAAANVTYLDENGGKQYTGDDVTEVENSTTSWGTAGAESWYVVNSSSVTIGSRVTVKGNVHLILADNCTLEANSGITVGNGNSLTIYAQSENETSMGKLIATSNGDSTGIGGSGFGGSGGTITINGGTVTATGKGEGAGIGGGYRGSGGTITINGGTVTATGKGEGAGIGGGERGSGGTITINGGTVTATGNGQGAGIGGGYRGSGGTIIINGGKITATGKRGGAGIGGGGNAGSGEKIIIRGENTEVTATSGTGAGIGGGGYYEVSSGSPEHGTSGGTITIEGGTVTATGGEKSAGIGGSGGCDTRGNGGNGGTITISGGAVSVTGGNGNNDSGGNKPPDIGGGYGKGGIAATDQIKIGVNATVTHIDGSPVILGPAHGQTTGWTYSENQHWHPCGIQGCTAADHQSTPERHDLQNPTTDTNNGSITKTCECGYRVTTTLNRISIKTQPALNYSEGETLDLSSLKITAVYSDNTNVELYYNSSGVACSIADTAITNGATLTKADHNGKQITVSYYGQTVSTNALQVKSANAGVTSVSVDGTTGSISGTTVTVTLPFGTASLPVDSSKIDITKADPVAQVSDPNTDDDGKTWTFTVTAEDGTTKTYTINVSIAPDPATENQNDIAAAKSTGDEVDSGSGGGSTGGGSDSGSGGSSDSGSGGSSTLAYGRKSLSSGGVALSGDCIYEYARLTVTKDRLHDSGDCGYCGQIRKWQEQGSVIAIYDVSLSYGFKGTVTLTFPVSSEYNGKTLTLVRCLKSRLDSYDVTISDGKVTVTTDSLSLFAILNKEEPGRENSETGTGRENSETGTGRENSEMGTGTEDPGTGNPFTGMKETDGVDEDGTTPADVTGQTNQSGTKSLQTGDNGGISPWKVIGICVLPATLIVGTTAAIYKRRRKSKAGTPE